MKTLEESTEFTMEMPINSDHEHSEKLSEQQSFYEQLKSRNNVSHLFDFINDIYFFIKNERSEFMAANQPLLNLLGLHEETAIIGTSDNDYFSDEIAAKFRKDDEAVINSDEAIINRVEWVPNTLGTIDWYMTTKIPLYNNEGKVIGIAATMKDFKKSNIINKPYSEMSSVIEYIKENYSKQISIKELADLVFLSPSQFDRKFKKLFKITPLKYINQVRISMACQMMTQSDMSLSQIARNTGFFDQSYFSKIFTKIMSVTPKQYKKKFEHG